MLSLLAFVEHTGASADAYPREAGRVLIAVIDEDRDVRPQARAATLKKGGPRITIRRWRLVRFSRFESV
jgi:hypothetical protein